MTRDAGRRRIPREWFVTAPSLAWLVVLFLVPALIVIAVAFRPSTPFGGIGEGWTLATWRGVLNPTYAVIVWRTVWLSLVTTAACLVLAVPMAYFMARAPRRRQQALLLAVIVPFWTSFLIRVFAWKVLLHPDGALKHLLVLLRLAAPDATLLYGDGAVLLVMIYTELPFAILPLYAAAERFDFRLLEAARDLGASPPRAFVAVFLPGIRRGLVTATLVVLIPALGSYVIPDIVGGPATEMIGNRIAQRAFTDRNLPEAGALSTALTLAVLLPALVVLAQRRRSRPAPEPEP